MLVGVGTARMATQSFSMTMSANRARVEIARQMVSIAREMIRDYQAGSEGNYEAILLFQEFMTVRLTQVDVSGARVAEMDMADDGTIWAVVYMDRATAAREIIAAQAQAALAVPAMASFNAEARMNEVFARINAQERQNALTRTDWNL